MLLLTCGDCRAINVEPAPNKVTSRGRTVPKHQSVKSAEYKLIMHNEWPSKRSDPFALRCNLVKLT